MRRRQRGNVRAGTWRYTIFTMVISDSIKGLGVAFCRGESWLDVVAFASASKLLSCLL